MGVGVNVDVDVDVDVAIGIGVDAIDSACISISIAISISGAVVVWVSSSSCVNCAKSPVRIIPIKDPPGCIVLFLRIEIRKMRLQSKGQEKCPKNACNAAVFFKVVHGTFTYSCVLHLSV